MDTRTIILSDDGRHVSLGRHSVPTDAEIAAAGAQLAAIGVGGWLATLSGNYHAKRSKLRVELVREVAPPRKLFTEALVEFARIRKGGAS